MGGRVAEAVVDAILTEQEGMFKPSRTYWKRGWLEMQ
jgi:hypothetical protein